jgi:hypothetical protein
MPDFERLRMIVNEYRNCVICERCGSNAEIKEVERDAAAAETDIDELEKMYASTSDPSPIV